LKTPIIAIAILLLFFITGSSNAQSLSIANIYKVSLRNTDAIKEGTEVRGYYFFYVSDKVDKTTNEYTLRITDNNLKIIKDIKFQDSKSVMVLESSFNGSDLMFVLYDRQELSLEYQVYGPTGEKKYIYTRTLNKADRKIFESTYAVLSDEDERFKIANGVEGRGFLGVRTAIDGKGYVLEANFYSSQTQKQWTYAPPEKFGFLVADYLGIFRGVAFIRVLRSQSGDEQETLILGLDIETGKKIFEIPTNQKRYKFYPSSFAVLADGRAVVSGEYFYLHANVNIDKPLGFAFVSMNQYGAILAEKYCSWENELENFVEVNNGVIRDFGYIFLHNIVYMTDGNIFAIGEGYEYNGKVTDMMLIRFDKRFNPKELKIFKKNPNTAKLPKYAHGLPAQLVSKLIKYSKNGFDYSYTQQNTANNSFTLCYTDYVKDKGYKGKTFNSITYAEGKLSSDRLNITQPSSSSYILPGKQGQVLILEYFEKEKKLDAHFEKLN
jgi:hypothetical protein